MEIVRKIPLLRKLVFPQKRAVWPYLSYRERKAENIDDLVRRVSARLYEERERSKSHELKIIVDIHNPLTIEVSINGFPTSAYTDRIAFLEFRLDQKTRDRLDLIRQGIRGIDGEDEEYLRELKIAYRLIERELQKARRAVECIVASHPMGYEYHEY